MTGRSLHDALLTVLCDGHLRVQLLDGTGPPRNILAGEEWTVLRRLSKQRLRGLSRFFARHYYQERVVRLFRYVRLLAPTTGRDPCRVLHTPEIVPILDHAVLGSPGSATRVLAAIEGYLTDSDEAIQVQWPFWRDLIRYQAALFQIEAQAACPSRQTRHPQRSPSAQILDFDWDLPKIFEHLRSSGPAPLNARTPATLLVARLKHGQVLTARCTPAMRAVLAAANGQRSEEDLARTTRLSMAEISSLLPQLRRIYAIL